MQAPAPLSPPFSPHPLRANPAFGLLPLAGDQKKKVKKITCMKLPYRLTLAGCSPGVLRAARNSGRMTPHHPPYPRHAY